MSLSNEEKEISDRKIARTIEELPKIPEDYIRLVHITSPRNENGLFTNGLDYQKYGIAMSVARGWNREEEVEVWADGPRFNFPGAKALIMDIPNKDWLIHNNLTRKDLPKAPGIILPKYIVGFVDSEKPTDL